MQKTAKKFLSMLLALMMVLSILPTAVFATEQGTVAAPLGRWIVLFPMVRMTRPQERQLSVCRTL